MSFVQDDEAVGREMNREGVGELPEVRHELLEVCVLLKLEQEMMELIGVGREDIHILWE